MKHRLISAENIIKFATDITAHDVRWKDRFAKTWVGK
jgi:hypothetical protein